MKRLFLIGVVGLALTGCGESKKDKEMREMEEQVFQSMTQEVRDGKVWDYRTIDLENGVKRKIWSLTSYDAVYKSPYSKLVINKLSDGANMVSFLAEHTEFRCREEYCPFVAKFDDKEYAYTFDASTSSPNSQVILRLKNSEFDGFIENLKKSKKLTISGGFFPVEMPEVSFNVEGLSDLNNQP